MKTILPHIPIKSLQSKKKKKISIRIIINVVSTAFEKMVPSPHDYLKKSSGETQSPEYKS